MVVYCNRFLFVCVPFAFIFIFNDVKLLFVYFYLFLQYVTVFIYLQSLFVCYAGGRGLMCGCLFAIAFCLCAFPLLLLSDVREECVYFFFMMRNYSGVREECVYFFVLHIVIQWMMRNYSGVRDSFVMPCKFSLQTMLIKRNFYSYCNVWLFIAIAFCLCAFPLLLFLFSTMSNFCLFTSICSCNT